jgi:Domain of unknown function (DUF4177)
MTSAGPVPVITDLQTWEYAFIYYSGGGSAGDSFANAIADLDKGVNEMGQQGWEMVNFTVQCHATASTDYKFQGHGPAVAATVNKTWSAVAAMKRPNIARR